MSILLYTLTLLFGVSISSHFRGATISWRGLNGFNVEFTITHGWRSTSLGNFAFQFGDGSSQTVSATISNRIGPIQNDLAGNSWSLHRQVVTHLYPGSGPYISSFTSCCRIGGLKIGANGGFKVESVVDLRNGNIGGPVAVLPPIVQSPLGTTVQFDLSPSDPDGQTVECRKSTSTESQITGLDTSLHFDITTDCKLIGSLPGGPAFRQGDKWATQIVLFTRDLVGNPMTETAIDFIFEGIIGNPPTCQRITNEPSGGFQVNIGSSLSIDFRVNDIESSTLTARATAISQYGTLSSTSIPSNGTLTYRVNIPNDKSLIGSDAGGTITIVDSSNLQAICRVGINIIDFPDKDKDGIKDDDDNCLEVYNPSQQDVDGDGIGDACDNCIGIKNPSQNDSDSDNVGDLCDNCVMDYNPLQIDKNGDGIGDVCDNPPDCSAAIPIPKCNYDPPFDCHIMINVGIDGVVDSETNKEFITYKILGIYQNQPVCDAKNPNDPYDAICTIFDKNKFKIRKDQTNYKPRLYHIKFAAYDNIGKNCTGSINIGMGWNKYKDGDWSNINPSSIYNSCDRSDSNCNNIQYANIEPKPELQPESQPKFEYKPISNNDYNQLPKIDLNETMHYLLFFSILIMVSIIFCKIKKNNNNNNNNRSTFARYSKNNQYISDNDETEQELI